MCFESLEGYCGFANNYRNVEEKLTLTELEEASEGWWLCCRGLDRKSVV